jgi:integral membrane protein
MARWREKNEVLMLKTPALSRFRAIAQLEGLSFILLLFIAMPLKYLAGMPMGVKVVGWAHGMLFVLYLLLLVEVAVVHRWPLVRILGAFIASLVPFGTFVLDARLRREEQASTEPAAS